MNKKQSAEKLPKRFLPMAELTESDDSRRNHSSDNAGSYLKKKSDLLDHSIASPVLSSTVSSLSSSRSTIDAQTYVDAQSNGLSSRIIRYYEENNKKSKLGNRMYKRPGDFPIVHLDKPKLVLTPGRSVANPPKMARIGQPDPSIYRTNLRAEILRNGTMMPQMSVDRREDADSSLVRVDPLDALKEISRKRIHCEDTINQKQIGPIEPKDSTDSIPSGNNFNNSKRQRITSSSNSPSATESIKKGQSNSRCNEIFSSLSSSSYLLTPLTLTSPLKRVEANSSIASNSSILPPLTKRLQSDQSIEPPYVEKTVKSVPKTCDVIPVETVETTLPTEPIRPKLTLFNRPYSTSVLPAINVADRNDECNITFVKPRPMTARSRESVENWLKVKPIEKKRLSLMLSCLSGEIDDGDFVDGNRKTNETSMSASSPNVPPNCSLKEIGDKGDARDNNTETTVASTSPNLSLSTVLATKPTIAFSPLTTPVTSTITDPIIPLQVASAIQERKGGFSFPITANDNPSTASSSVAPVSSTVAPASSIITLALPTVTLAVTPVLSTATPSSPVAMTSTNPNVNTEPSTNSIPTPTPSVTYTFHLPKQNVVSSSTIVEPTKTFSFGNTSTSTTNEPKAIPTFDSPQAQSVTTTVTKTSLTDIPKTNSFAAFGQTTSTGIVQFGKPISSSTPSTTSVFGTTAISNSSSFALDKAEPPSFGSISTNAKPLSNDKPTQSNNSVLFGKNQQTPAFGSALSNNKILNAPKQVDPRISNGESTTSFISNQPLKPTPTTTIGQATSVPFTFGTPTTASSVFKTAQPALSTTSNSFGVPKPINSSSNIFGSLSSHGSTTEPIFGAGTNANTNLTSKNLAEKQSTAAQNMFGSSTTKPSSFSFSGNHQSSTSNLFGGQTATGGAFNSGGSIQKTDASSGGTSDKNKSFTFGGNSGEPTKPVVFGSKSSATTFGNANVNDTVKTFGFTANNQTNATNLFDNKSTNEAPKIFSFGANSGAASVGTSNAATFGATGGLSSTSSFGASATATFGTSATPSFGSTNTTPTFGGTNATSTFGGTNATSTFGGTNATSTFGSTNATPTFGSTNATPTFGGSNAAQTFSGTNSAPKFGSTNATPTFGGLNSTQTFGGVNATPTFGNTNVAVTFGGTNAAPKFGSTNATPTFGAANVTPTFGGLNATQTFGGTNATQTFGGTNATSTFGGSNATPAFGSSNTTPVFGTQSFNGNIGTPTFGGAGSGSFGGSTGSPAFSTSTGTADVNKTFNFTGNDPTPSPIPNLFNIGPGNSAPRGRTIRTATRRTYR